MSFPIHFFTFVVSLLLLQNCGSESGGSNTDESNLVPKAIEISVLGLKELEANELQIQYSDKDTITIKKDQTIKLDNTSARSQSKDIKIIAQPSQQACVLRTLSDKGSSTLVMRISCGYRNEIRVTGIEGSLAADNPLIVTRSPYYYDNPTTQVSPYAVKSIFKNSEDFSTDEKGNPKGSYYSFLNTLADNAIPAYIQVIRIVKQPAGYRCTSFYGKSDLVQIICIKDKLALPFYSLAKKCIAIQASDESGFITKDEAGNVKLAAVDISDAEKFYVKPSRLGAFLLYDEDSKFLSSESNLLTSKPDPSSSTEWKIHDEDTITFEGEKSEIIQKQVIVPYFDDKDKRLKHNLPEAETLSFSDKETEEEDVHKDLSTYKISPEAFNVIEVNSSECTAFPEASLNATISPDFYLPKNPSEPIVGYADIHAHYAFPMAIGGMAMSGNIVHPYGIESALGNCHALHGNDGSRDLLATQFGPTPTHNTTGYPTFTDWPNKDSITHVQAYYRWIERAYLSGLRLSVTLATGNPSLCQILQELNPGMNRAGGCSGITAVKAQTDYIYEIQDYIDAQEGGPGKGWFRIVKTPQEARNVISDNKLAVVLGSEHGELFDCREKTNCPDNDIDERLADAIEQGLRVFFPVDRFDNAFAGAMLGGGVNNAWMNLSSRLSTSWLVDLANIVNFIIPDRPIEGHYWEVKECPPGVNGVSNLYSMEDFKNKELLLITDPLRASGFLGVELADALEAQLGLYPNYEGFREGQGGNACNVRGLHAAGKYLVEAMIDKGLIVDVGHMSYKASMEALTIFEENTYSGVMSSQGSIEGSSALNNRITNLGGILGISNAIPTGFAANFALHGTETISNDYLKSFPLGSDIQGISNQPGVDSATQITYPFTSYDENVVFEKPKTGNREFDFNSEGVAHYGLYAEWIEALGKVDESLLKDFMNSAEAYIQMWERAEAQAAIN